MLYIGFTVKPMEMIQNSFACTLQMDIRTILLTFQLRFNKGCNEKYDTA